MTTGRPDFTAVNLIKGRDTDGNLVTIAVDASGNIIGLLKGAYGGVLKTLATDTDGRILARLQGRYGDLMMDVAVDGGGKLAITEISQSNVSKDDLEAQTWTTPIANLLSNMNRIRYAIINMSGEAWGTFSHSIASTWAQIDTAIGVHAALPDVHHAQAHTLASHTTKAHNELTGIGADDHHARQHALNAGADHTGRAALSQMPDGAAALVLTGQGVGSDPAYAAVAGGPTIVRKTADETVNNSAVLQDDNELKLSVGANEIWYVEIYLKFSTWNYGIKGAFALPAGATFKGFTLGGVGVLTSSQGATRVDFSDSKDIIQSGTEGDQLIRGVYVGAAAAGTIQFKWAQITAEVHDYWIFANSFILAHKLA